MFFLSVYSLVIATVSLDLLKVCLSKNVDPLGYILYCPCMGRFGNQADHFLGALGFAHGLNRTLVLPPWVEYRYGEPKSMQVPFDTYFQTKPLQDYHRIQTMEKFMKDVAPNVWPPSERIAFCYASRGNGNSCNAKEGNPFGPFWDTYSVDFVKSEFYGPLHYDIYHHDMARQWKNKYPPEKWPVLAFTGAPASFPVQFENRALQKYMKWSEKINRKADDFIKNVLVRGAFIGVHLRNGIDWVRACGHIPQSPNLFAAPQCLGYQNDRGRATTEMCLPSKVTIIRQLKRVVKSYNGRSDRNKIVKSVFVASDSNHMIAELTDGLRRMNVSVFKYDGDSPHVDLAILGKSNHFIANCISSYSAFVKRERDASGFPSSFWAFPVEKNSNIPSHDEF